MKTKYPFNKTYKLTLSIGFYGADREDEYDPSADLTEDQWNNMSDSEKEDWLYETAVERFQECIEYSFE